MARVGPVLPAEGLVAAIAVEEALVVSHWRGHGKGESPDEPNAQQRVAGDAQGGGAPRVHDGHIAVHGHGRECEDAHQHGDGEEVMDELADEGAQHPSGQHVDRGLEGDAEEQVGQVGDTQVEDEDVGGTAALARLAASQNRDHQRVAQHPQGKDQAEDDQGDEVLDADAEEGLPLLLRQPGSVELHAGRLCPLLGPVEGLPRLHPLPLTPSKVSAGGRRRQSPATGGGRPRQRRAGVDGWRGGGGEGRRGGGGGRRLRRPTCAAGCGGGSAAPGKLRAPSAPLRLRQARPGSRYDGRSCKAGSRGASFFSRFSR